MGRVMPFSFRHPKTTSSSRVEKLNKAVGPEELCTVSGKNTLNIGLTPHRSFKVYTGFLLLNLIFIGLGFFSPSIHQKSQQNLPPERRGRGDIRRDGGGLIRPSFELQVLSVRHSEEFEVGLLSQDFCPGLELVLEWKRFVCLDGNL